MKKFCLGVIACILLCSCSTTFEERRVIYKAVFNKVYSVAKTVGPIAAEMYLKKEIAKGKISTEDAELVKLAVNSALQK